MHAETAHYLIHYPKFGQKGAEWPWFWYLSSPCGLTVMHTGA